MSHLQTLLNSTRVRLEREVLAIESRTDLSPDEKVQQIVLIFSGVCAGIAIQPVPFADIFLLTPVQAYMGSRISAIRGIPMAEKDVTDVLKEVAGVAGLGLLAQQVALGAYKTGLPFLAGFTTIPLVFGLTYAMGQVMDTYFINRTKGRRMSEGEVRDAWAKARAQGTSEGRKRAREVLYGR